MNGKNGNSATDYTGGGGGGGGGGWGVTNVKGGQGGSGVVLVKYTLCTLTTATGGGGSVTTPGSGSYTETQYSLTAITATPDSCHTFSSWTVTAGSGTLTDSSSASTTINMTDNCTVQANFAYKTYTLTYINGSHGSISGILTQTVNCGADGSAVTAVPDACYHFTTWSDTGTSTNPRTDTGVVASVTATANFAINTYTLNVNASPSAGGSASGGGSGLSARLTGGAPPPCYGVDSAKQRQ